MKRLKEVLSILPILNLSLYNAYNRQNPYFVYAVREGAGIRFKKLTVFPILPSVSYGVRF